MKGLTVTPVFLNGDDPKQDKPITTIKGMRTATWKFS